MPAGDYMYAIDGVPIGRVMRFEGNPPSHRWVAYARRDSWRDDELRKAFRTRREAVSWMEQEALARNLKYETETG